MASYGLYWITLQLKLAGRWYSKTIAFIQSHLGYPANFSNIA